MPLGGKMSTLSRLFRPLDYIRVKHPEKPKYDFFIPFCLSATGTVGLMLLPVTPAILGDGGVVGIFTGLLQMLIGFYIASLAAIATFNKKGMDQIMPGDPPTLRVSLRGKIKIDKLTRRRLLCLMFGYLALLSLFLYFIGSGAALVNKSIRLLVPETAFYWIKWSLVGLYLFLAANLMVTTLLSLFYMVDRIHRNDPVLIKKQ